MAAAGGRGVKTLAIPTTLVMAEPIDRLASRGSFRTETVQDSPIGNDPDEDGGEHHRRDERDSLFMLARLRPSGASAFENVRVRNVSSGGLMAQVGAGYRPGMRVDVELEGLGAVSGSVAWAEAGRIGIAFDHPVDKARARKTVGGKDEDLFRHASDFKRPPLRPR